MPPKSIPPWMEFERTEISKLQADIVSLDAEIQQLKEDRLKSYDRFAKLRAVVRRQQDAEQERRAERSEHALPHWQVSSLQRLLEVKK